jgi:hypothetical protein
VVRTVAARRAPRLVNQIVRGKSTETERNSALPTRWPRTDRHESSLPRSREIGCAKNANRHSKHRLQPQYRRPKSIQQERAWTADGLDTANMQLDSILVRNEDITHWRRLH